MPTYEQMGFGGGAVLTGDRARSVFGQVMGLVAFTLGFTALGAYIARNFAGGGGILFFLVVLGCMFGLNIAANRGHEQLAMVLLFAMGLALGMFFAPILDYYAKANPEVVYQAAGATALFVALLGSFGYSTRRDLAPAARLAFFALIALWIVALIMLFVAVPGGNVVWCVAALAIFSVFTAFDFQRLSRRQFVSPVPIAAAIFLDVFYIFVFLLSLFGGGGSSRR